VVDAEVWRLRRGEQDRMQSTTSDGVAELVGEGCRLDGLAR